MSDQFPGQDPYRTEQLPPSYRTPTSTPNGPFAGGMDRGTARLAMIAGGLGAGLVVLIALFSGGGHHRGGVPVIEAESGPVRIKPENPGGMKLSDAGVDMTSDVPDAEGKLAPAAETPQTSALRAEMQADRTEAAPVHADEPEQPVAEPHRDMLKPSHVAERIPDRAAEHDAAAAEPKPAAKAAAPVAAGSGHAQVQLAALDSEDAAKAEWQRLQKRVPDLLGGHSPVVTKVDRDGKVFYRLRTGGFTDLAQATGFCAQLKAKSVACSLAAF